jgi:hypothetical protein
MKTAILTIALVLASALSALAQTVMRENSIVYYQTNVFLHDDGVNPLHQRISAEGQEPLWVAASNQVAYYQSSEMTNASIHARYLYSTNATLTGYLPLSGYDGLVVLGAKTRGYAASTNLGEYGFAAGIGTSAGQSGFAAGASTSAGKYGFAAGASTSAGQYGFAAGAVAKGAGGSFVFADNSAGGTPFNRTNRPNEFSARAAGGVYFDTPLMAVTGTVSAGSFAAAAGLTATQGVSQIILPTATNGLVSGTLWNDAGTVKVMP